MKLEQLLEGVPFTLVQGSLDTEVQDIIYDSRKAAPGLAFVCIVGTQRDSHEFAADCAAKGVSVLVIQHDIDLSAMPGVTVVKVESSRYAMALMSGNLFGNPSRQMTMIGVTGTKGKTTTTHMIKSVLEAAGRKVGMIGTNGIYFLGRHQETANTTPESYELQKTFREFLDAGCDTADELLTMGCRRVDRVILTHFDDDHINGVEHLLARMGAETLTIPKAEGGAALDRLLELAERYGMDVETVTEETHLPFGNGELTIFPPLGVSGSNELGLTVLASAGEHGFLITGDMERATEKKLIETYELPELDVLMAGHHGSKNSTSKELLDAVTPGMVIISVGSNSYGHPAEDTLRRLARAGCDIYRTDRHGTVYLSFD